MVGSRCMRSGLAATVLALAIGGAAQAAPLVPGSVLIPAAAEAQPVGGMSVASVAVPFSVTGAFSGTLFTDVISGDTSNPFGGLTFVYRVASDGVAGPNSIGRLSIDNFLGFLLDGSYAPTAGVAPASIDRNVSADVVGFNFVPTPVDPLAGFLVPGSSSARLVIQTNAPGYTDATATMIDGGAVSVRTYGPAVPEPASLGLAGIAAAGLLRRRRHGR